MHLFVAFGLSFRDEFVKLKKPLFDLLWSHPLANKTGAPTLHTQVPVLVMTATCRRQTLHDFSHMTGISVGHNMQSVFWGTAIDLMSRKQFLEVNYTNQALAEFKKVVFPILHVDRCLKFMWFTNNRYLVEKHIASLISDLDSDPAITMCDVVPLTGRSVY